MRDAAGLTIAVLGIAWAWMIQQKADALLRTGNRRGWALYGAVIAVTAWCAWCAFWLLDT